MLLWGIAVISIVVVAVGVPDIVAVPFWFSVYVRPNRPVTPVAAGNIYPAVGVMVMFGEIALPAFTVIGVLFMLDVYPVPLLAVTVRVPNVVAVVCGPLTEGAITVPVVGLVAAKGIACIVYPVLDVRPVTGVFVAAPFTTATTDPVDVLRTTYL